MELGIVFMLEMGPGSGGGFGVAGGSGVEVGDEIVDVDEDMVEVGDGNGNVTGDPSPAL